MSVVDSAQVPAGARAGSDWLDTASLAYLALPNIIFLSGWIASPYGPLAALVLTAALAVLVWRTPRVPLSLRLGPCLIALGVALVWLALSGVGHLVFANQDWVVRDAVAYDLTRLPWPVEYRVPHHDLPVLLRAPLGYYLPATLLARVVGADWLQQAMFAWTLAGVMIVFLMIASRFPRPKAFAVVILVFVFFSGLDIVGWLLKSADVPDFGEHIEWWARFAQYSSQTTQLFWVPNHALPAWLVTAWLWRQKGRPMPVGVAVALVALTPLWSPLASIGLVPLVFAFGVRDVALAWRAPAGALARWLREAVSPAMLVIAAVTLLLIDPYLLLAGDTVQSMWVTSLMTTRQLLGIVPLFILLEFGLYWIFLARRFPFDLLLIVSGLVLLALPFYRLGPASDLTMRASIPALMVFALRLGEWFSESLAPEAGKFVDSAWASLAMVVFVVGMVTPFQELVRPFVEEERPIALDATVYQAAGGEATHYLADLQGAWVARFLKPSTPYAIMAAAAPAKHPAAPGVSAPK